MNEFTPTHCPFCTRRIEKIQYPKIGIYTIKCKYCKNNDVYAFEVNSTDYRIWINLMLNSYKVTIDYRNNTTIISLKDREGIIRLNFIPDYFDPEALTKSIKAYIVFS